MRHEVLRPEQESGRLSEVRRRSADGTLARGRAAAVEKDEEEPEAGVELVSLDEVESEEAALETVAGDDVEIEDEGADDDDTFLEEEEEDSDDVSGLIDGDIAPDEEP